MEQRTDEWHQTRLGKVTASKVADVMAKTKSGYSASRDNYMADLITERMTGQPTNFYVNSAMQWGTDTEPQARAMYELECGVTVLEHAFEPHPTITMSGASPDGLVGSDGLVEIKCPQPATHIATLRGAKIPDKYRKQMMWQMACTGRKWCDFASFDPRLPEPMQLHIARVERDDELIAEMESEVRKFLAEIDAAIDELESKYLRKEAA